MSLMGGHIRGVVTGWRPEKFLAYTWNVYALGQKPYPNGRVSYLEFTLVEEDGKTRLVLMHRPIPDAMQKQTRRWAGTPCSI